MDISFEQEPVEVLVDSEIFSSLQKNGFRYSMFNVAGPGCEQDPSLICFEGCNCIKTDCNPNDCTCNLLNYDGIKLKDLESTNPVFECNAMCKCGTTCRNRLVQHGVATKLEVFDVGNKGLGVRTRQIIERGGFVCEYAGEVLSHEEATLRTCWNNDMNYIISVREYTDQNSKPPTVTYVDPKYVGNVGRFINHSCQPNLVMIPVRIDSTVPHLALFAIQRINPFEELTFHYGGENTSQSADCNCRALEGQRLSQKPCYCGATLCRGFLPFDSTSLPV